MALTTTTKAGTTIRKYAFGSNTIQSVSFESDVPLGGQVIQVRIAPYLENSASIPTAVDSLFSYQVVFPISPLTVNVPALGTLHPTARRFSVRLTRLTDTTFTIHVSWLFTADIDAFPVGSTYNNLHHFTRNNVGAINEFDNSASAVYNEVNIFRIEATAIDGVNVANAVFDQPYIARYLCETGGCCTDLDLCMDLPVLSWSYTLERLGLPVNNFSSFDNTTIKWKVQLGTGHAISKYWIAIYRVNDVGNIIEYWDDLELNYGEVVSNAITPIAFAPFSDAAFLTVTDFALVSGDIYEATIEIDASYFTLGGCYRVMIIGEDDNTGEEYSCHTGVRAVCATDLPEPITGDTDSNIWIYDKATTTHNVDCVLNLATRQRIKIDCTMDKVSYNTNLFNAGLLTDFDTNLLSTDIVITETLPVATDSLIGGEIQKINFAPNVNTDGLRTTFRVPESWSAGVRYIIFIWKFLVTTSDGFIYNDEIRKPIKLLITENDEITTNNFTHILTDALAAVIDKRICDDLDGEINICWSEVLPADYDFIPIIKEGTTINEFEEYREDNFYTNTELTQLATDEYLTAEDDTSVDGEACATIEPSELQLNADIELGGVFIEQSPAPPAACANIAVDFGIEILTTTSNNTKTILTYDLTPLVDADILQVEVHADWNGQLLDFTAYTATDSRTWTLVNGGDFNWIDVAFTVEITLVTGCSYSLSFGLSLANVDLNTDNYIDTIVPN